MSVLTWLKENKAGVAKWGILSLSVLLLSFIIFNIAKGRPNNHNETVYGIVMVAVDSNLRDHTDTWSADNMETVRKSLAEVQRLGPTVRLAEGESTISIYKTRYENCLRDGPAAFITDRVTGAQRIEVDPRCTHSSLELQAVIVHELGHFLGMGHVCTNATRTRSDCSPVGNGDAVMNPGLLQVDPTDLGPTFEEVHTGPFPVWEITQLDYLEFRRAWNLRHPNPK